MIVRPPAARLVSPSSHSHPRPRAREVEKRAGASNDRGREIRRAQMDEASTGASEMNRVRPTMATKALRGCMVGARGDLPQDQTQRAMLTESAVHALDHSYSKGTRW